MNEVESLLETRIDYLQSELKAKDEEIEKLKEIIAGLREALQKSAGQLLDYVDRGHL